MNIIDKLGKMYHDINNDYAAVEAKARARGHHRKEEKYAQKRTLNDQAYFLFIFTRLEDRINDLTNSIINYKSDLNSNYKNQRAWQILKTRNDNGSLNLMEKVSFLTRYNGPNYHRIMSYKRQRDTISHGGLVPSINMTVEIQRMSNLYNSLRK